MGLILISLNQKAPHKQHKVRNWESSQPMLEGRGNPQKTL
jgi:hypothetical protein